VADIGCAIVGATADIAPADRRLYGVRDVTGTVESIDLITASILSKKLAAGLEALVLDVKVGSGAFMAAPADAHALAEALVKTAQGAGCMTSALITDMNQPLVPSAGNALEVIEVMEALTGGDMDTDLMRITLALGGEVLALGGLAADAADGEGGCSAPSRPGRRRRSSARWWPNWAGRRISSTAGATGFRRRRSWSISTPTRPAIVAAIDTRALGEAVVQLGGGRLKQDDRLDLAVGLSDIARIGEEVDTARRFCASMPPARRPRAPWRAPARGVHAVRRRRSFRPT
jgi:thymidine phosphorylase